MVSNMIVRRRRKGPVDRRKQLKSLIPEATESDIHLLVKSSKISMTSAERLWALLQAVRYVEANQIPGDFVECGVWRGGSSFLMASALMQLGSETRNLWLFDTFEGMVAPTEKDFSTSGIPARDLLNIERKNKEESLVWAVASETEVLENMQASGYPKHKVRLVKGDVCETLNANLIDKVAIARLDTDWYDSTRHELETLMPKMAQHGVVIVDDYGHWSGSKQAVDEWLRDSEWKPLMNRIDYTGRLWIAP